MTNSESDNSGQELHFLQHSVENASDAMFWVDADARYLYVNKATCASVGYSREEMLGMSVAVIAPSFSIETWPLFFKDVQQRGSLTFESVHRSKNGQEFPVEVNLNYVHYSGQDYLFGSARDISERKRSDNLILQMARGASAAKGPEYLQSLVLRLAGVLNADYAFVSEISAENPGIARTLCVFAAGKKVDDFSYELAGTPCVEVLSRKSCIYPSGVQQQFPHGVMLGKLNVEGYGGAPLLNSRGHLLGVLAVLYRSSMPEALMVQSTLEIFAASVAAELDNRNAAKQLSESESRYRTLFESAGDGIFLMSGTVLIDCNRKALELFQCERDEIIGRTPSDFSMPMQPDGSNSREKTLEMIALAAQGQTPTFEWQSCRLDGSQFPTEVTLSSLRLSGETRYLAIVKDITERKLAENALRGSEHRLRELLETVQLVAVILDAHGNITFCNAFLLRITGWSANEVLGKSWFEIFLPPEHRDPVRETFVYSLSSGKLPAHHENPIMTRDGIRRLVEWDNTLLRDLNGNVTGTASLGRDVTDLRALEELYRQSQKLESIGRLAGGVAHDFNNLLTVINGYSDILLHKFAETDSAHVSLLEIKKAGERAAALTRQLLAFSRRQVLELSVLDLNVVISEALRLLRRLIGEDVELHAKLEPSLGRVRADASQIHQVLLNLAVNARDAMPAGGKLVIELSNVSVDETSASAHSGIVHGKYVLLVVSDTGSGMTEDTKAHLFEPFFTTKEQGKGTGLGLSTVYGIIRQSEGYISVVSELGVGSSFRIYLPRVDDRLANDAAKADLSDQRRGTETILIVEDHDDVRRLLSSVLKNSGYVVLDAANGAEALLITERHSGAIDLVITDIVMPGMTGRDLAARLRILRPQTKVLFMSGYADSEIVDQRATEPSGAYIQKPFPPNVLAARVRQMLDGKVG